MPVKPKVTVFIPVYNRAAYIAEAIESILAQSFSNFELLLIDDGSTDGSLEIMRSYLDPRLRVVRNGRNLGIPQTRNKGLELARGDYLAILDSDDCAYPDRLAQQVDFLDQHAEYAAVGSWVVLMKEGHKPRKVGILPVSAKEVRARLLFHCSLTHASVMARTTILREYGYREQYAVCSDFDLWVRIAEKYKLGNLPSFLVRRRLHNSRVTCDRASLVKEKKLQLFSRQLAGLDIPCTRDDAERHFLLLRMRAARFTPNPAYLVWAEAWLRTLQTANARTSRHPERLFAQVVGEVWFAVCWQAMPVLGWRAWAHFCRSSLSHTIWSSVGKYASLWANRRFPE